MTNDGPRDQRTGPGVGACAQRIRFERRLGDKHHRLCRRCGRSRWLNKRFGPADVGPTSTASRSTRPRCCHGGRAPPALQRDVPRTRPHQGRHEASHERLVETRAPQRACDPTTSASASTSTGATSATRLKPPSSRRSPRASARRAGPVRPTWRHASNPRAHRLRRER